MILGVYETFNSQSRNIGELLGANERARIMVPQFQRGYSWERKHVRDFWTDLTTFQKESAVKDGPDKYFMGPIVVRAESKFVIWLLDGQQRWERLPFYSVFCAISAGDWVFRPLLTLQETYRSTSYLSRMLRSLSVRGTRRSVFQRDHSVLIPPTNKKPDASLPQKHTTCQAGSTRIP